VDVSVFYMLVFLHAAVNGAVAIGWLTCSALWFIVFGIARANR